MSITAMMQAMQATAMRHRAQNLLFSANQNLMRLSSSVRPDMTSRDIFRLQQQEIKFAAQQASFMYRVALLMEEQAQRLIKASQDLKRRLMDAGATFV